MESFGALCKFLPILVGLPTEKELHSQVQTKGTAVIVLTTPIVAENEAIFLRTLIGRTLTAFHTMGGRHVVRGFYLDMIIDELRNNKWLLRAHIFAAWIDYLGFLCSLNQNEITWEKIVPSEVDAAATKDGELPSTSPRTYGLRAKTPRHIQVSNSSCIEFDCGLRDIIFEGVHPIKDPAFEKRDPRSTDVDESRSSVIERTLKVISISILIISSQPIKFLTSHCSFFW